MVSVLIGMAALFTTIDPVQLTEYMLVFSAVTLPLTYLPILVVANDRDYLGDHVNGPVANAVGMVYLVVILVAAVAAIPLMVIEFSVDGGGLDVAALLVGQQALGRRIGGPLGRWMTAVARRLDPAPDPAPLRIAFDLVTEVVPTVRLSVRRELLVDPPLETWLREHLIDRIPGADHAEE